MQADFISKRVKKIAVKKMRETYVQDLIKEAYKIKDTLISEFLDHPVTVELNNGPDSYSNTSNTLRNSYGNLYSFIGFEKGTDPIKPILDIFLNIDIRQVTTGDNLFITIYGFPTPQKIWEATPMPWQDGRSWAKGIEEGISGLNYYLFSYSRNFENSRSGPAVQSRKQITSGLSFERKKYISSLLNKYKSMFRNLGRKDRTQIKSFFV
jgi:hypothetical protein